MFRFQKKIEISREQSFGCKEIPIFVPAEGVIYIYFTKITNKWIHHFIYYFKNYDWMAKRKLIDGDLYEQ